MTTFKHLHNQTKGVRIADKYVIQVWNANAHLETIGTPGHPVWGQPMSRQKASDMVTELRRINKYPPEYKLLPVKI